MKKFDTLYTQAINYFHKPNEEQLKIRKQAQDARFNKYMNQIKNAADEQIKKIFLVAFSYNYKLKKYDLTNKAYEYVTSATAKQIQNIRTLIENDQDIKDHVLPQELDQEYKESASVLFQIIVPDYLDKSKYILYYNIFDKSYIHHIVQLVNSLTSAYAEK